MPNDAFDPSRRSLLLRGLAVVGAATTWGCSKASGAAAFVCTDTGGLSPTDTAARERAAYADRALDPAKTCDRCSQFLPSPEGCGACKLLRGPVHPKGTCRTFSPAG